MASAVGIAALDVVKEERLAERYVVLNLHLSYLLINAEEQNKGLSH